jgi:uncharacterized HAD superfamily protein
MPAGSNPCRQYFIMSKTICLDLDGVITDIGQQVKNYLEKDSLEVNPDLIGDVLLTPDGVEYVEYIFEDPLFWRNLLPIKNSWHCINEWFSNGYDIVFITARRSEISQSEIDPWLNGWQIQYNDVIIADMYHKYEIIDKLQPLFFVDDNPREIYKVGSITGTAVAVMETWYNQHLIKSLRSVNKLTDLKIG